MNGLLLCEIYQPGKVELSVQLFALPEFASKSKFCEYVPPPIKTCAHKNCAEKIAEMIPTATPFRSPKNDRDFFTT
jgi:hypothetical protein